MAVAAAIGVEDCEDSFSRSKLLNKKLKKQAIRKPNNQVNIYLYQFICVHSSFIKIHDEWL